MKYCCKALESSTEEFGEFEYDKVNNRFIGYITNITGEGHGKRVLAYCPFCGTRLADFSDIYDDELEKTTGKDLCDIKDSDIPEEFKSDEWWKNREINESYIDHFYDPLRYEENINIINGERVLKCK